MFVALKLVIESFQMQKVIEFCGFDPFLVETFSLKSQNLYNIKKFQVFF